MKRQRHSRVLHLCSGKDFSSFRLWFCPRSSATSSFEARYRRRRRSIINTGDGQRGHQHMSDVRARSAIAVPRPIPVVLSFVAGYVDSCTYLGLFGVFVAQVTGSFVLAGTQFVKSEPGALAKLLAIPFFFFAGMADR